MKSVNRRLTMVGALVLLFFSSAALADVAEEFSGTGPFGIGFDADGWAITGATGSFSNNGLGESVYTVNSIAGSNPFSIDGLVRIVGTKEYDTKFEFSNAILDSTSSVALGINDFSAGGFASLSFQANSNGSHSAIFFINDGSGSGVQNIGAINTLDPIQQATLYLNYREDDMNGGGKFDALVKFNESGLVQLVGSVDGSSYTLPATSNRSLSVTTRAFQGNSALAEFDKFHLTLVPEPSSLLILSWLGFSLAFKRTR